MNKSVGIIGMGWVGSSVAISLLHSGVAEELLLSDLRTEVAEGEAMDLGQGSTFYPAATVRVATLAEMREASAVVVAVGNGSLPGGKSRLEQLAKNVGIVREIGAALVGYAGIVVVVSNPVDVLTHALADAAGLPPSRVIGTGTMLDTARLRQMVAQQLTLDSRSIHAHVVGEHGDSEVVLWSTARVGGSPLMQWPGWSTSSASAVADAVRMAGYEIVKRKGTSNHAIGLVTAELLRSVLRNEQRVLTVSRVQSDVPGFSDVALSLPAVVGADGATVLLLPEMSLGEREALERSADVLRAAQQSVSIH
jgi:L-lactate dehydrogenase